MQIRDCDSSCQVRVVWVNDVHVCCCFCSQVVKNCCADTVVHPHHDFLDDEVNVDIVRIKSEHQRLNSFLDRLQAQFLSLAASHRHIRNLPLFKQRVQLAYTEYRTLVLHLNFYFSLKKNKNVV